MAVQRRQIVFSCMPVAILKMVSVHLCAFLLGCVRGESQWFHRSRWSEAGSSIQTWWTNVALGFSLYRLLSAPYHKIFVGKLTCSLLIWVDINGLCCRVSHLMPATRCLIVFVQCAQHSGLVVKSTKRHSGIYLWEKSSWMNNVVLSFRLSRLALALLPIPANSTTSERVFSEAGRILEARRQQLSQESVDSLVFLRNFNTWIAPYLPASLSFLLLLFLSWILSRNENADPYSHVK